MTHANGLDRLFSIMVKLPWIQKERFRNGINGLLLDCRSEDQFDVIDHVLTQLKYCTSSDFEIASTNAAKTIETIWKLESSDTNIVGVAESNRTCGSTAFIRAIELKLPRTWANSIHTNFVSAFRLHGGKTNLVIVDDFIGTGCKINKKIESIRRNPNSCDYSIHVVTFAGMTKGIANVGDEVDGRIHSEIELNKCISELKPMERAATLSEAMRELETKIFENSGSYSFGYKQSEAAFYLEASNIPNNNFPILWWEKYADDSERSTLFTRR
jgi:hypothetical protein